MRSTRFLAFLLAASLLSPAGALAQGLGDAAKKERERRKTAAPAPAKAYTEDDLNALPPVVNEASPDGATASAPAGSAATAPLAGAQGANDEAERRARDEKTWRARMAAARERVELARKKYVTSAS